MQIKHRATLIDEGSFSSSSDFKLIIETIENAISKVVWPSDSNEFTIYPQSGKKTGEGNGVTPIKNEFINYLHKYNWELEKKLDIAAVKKPGKIDATYKVGSIVKHRWFVTYEC